MQNGFCYVWKRIIFSRDHFQSSHSRLFCLILHFSCSTHLNRKTTLPFSAHSGHIGPITDTDKTVFAEAAKGTNKQCLGNVSPLSRSHSEGRTKHSVSEKTGKQTEQRPWTIEGQKLELQTVGLDSSYLSPVPGEGGAIPYSK